jgi:hypothetical protein
MRVKEIDDPRSTHPATARSTIRPGTPRHTGHLPGFVCGLRALRRLRGERREGHHDLVPDVDSDDDERADDDRTPHDDVGDHDDDSPQHHYDRTDDRDHRAAERDDHAEDRDHGALDADHREEGRPDDCLHSPDDCSGYHHDDVCLDPVRSGVLFLGP